MWHLRYLVFWVVFFFTSYLHWITIPFYLSCQGSACSFYIILQLAVQHKNIQKLITELHMCRIFSLWLLLYSGKKKPGLENAGRTFYVCHYGDKLCGRNWKKGNVSISAWLENGRKRTSNISIQQLLDVPSGKRKVESIIKNDCSARGAQRAAVQPWGKLHTQVLSERKLSSTLAENERTSVTKPPDMREDGKVGCEIEHGECTNNGEQVSEREKQLIYCP